MLLVKLELIGCISLLSAYTLQVHEAWFTRRPRLTKVVLVATLAAMVAAPDIVVGWR
jgi:hypothetical protein